MPTAPDSFAVRVFYHTDAQRDLAVQQLQRVDAARMHLYNGVVEGAADAAALEALHAAGVLVMDAGGTGILGPRPPQPKAAPTPPTAGPSLLGASPPGSAQRATQHAAAQTAARRAASEELRKAVRARPGPTAAVDAAIEALRTESGGYNLNVDPQGPSIQSGAEEPVEDPDADGDMYNVTVRQPVLAAYRTELEGIGSGVASVEPPNVFRMFLRPKELEQVSRLDYVIDATSYTLEETVTPELVQSLPTGGAGAAGKAELFDLLLHRGRDHDRVCAAVRSAGGEVVDESARHMIRISIPMDVGRLGALAELPQVRKITHFTPPKLYADRARVLVGVEALNAGANGQPPAQTFTGAGETVAIFDSGVDADHPDLKDRIKARLGFQTAPVDDAIGHGTHVAGIIAGTGAASQGQIRGIAPGAELVVVGMVDANQQLLIPADIRELLKEAITPGHGAKIINLSWGNKFASEYEFGSLQLDWFVYEHEDVLVVVAAGNSGKINSEGRYEFSSVGTPATAKNALTVGACGTDRPGIAQKWSDDPWDVPAPPGDFAMCSADSVAVLSSRGPTDYESVKPDVCACGVYVASARAAQAAMQYWEPTPPAALPDKYAFLGGTSMAAPVVSGTAAVLREYLRVARSFAEPSAALLKAILIASARRLEPFTREMGDPFADAVGYPNFHQGFGRIDLSTVLPHPGAPQRRLLFDDVRNGTDRALQAQAPVGAKNAAARTYTVKVAQGAKDPLTVVLAWTDYPGKFLHNNLQLYVEAPGSVFVGNSELSYHRDAFAMDALAHGEAPAEVQFVQVPFDKLNNVEHVRITQPAAGEYRIVVLAQYTDPLVAAQGYALCVSGELESDKLDEG